jgi:import receptor subunit TOM20
VVNTLFQTFNFFNYYKIFQGDLDNGVDHLAQAVAVCSQPQSLMSLFQQTLPPELFQEIIMRLPQVAQV